MIEPREHFQNRPCHTLLALDRLIGIGIGTKRDGARLVARGGKLPLQQGRRIGLHIKPRLKIESGRQAEIGVGGPGVAIGAAVLAAAIGIDRPVKRQIGRIVARDDCFCLLHRDLGPERCQILKAHGIVERRFAHEALEPAAGIGHGATPAPLLRIDLRPDDGGAARSDEGIDRKHVLRSSIGKETKQEQNRKASRDVKACG